jgi:hypothetical protein
MYMGSPFKFPEQDSKSLVDLEMTSRAERAYSRARDFNNLTQERRNSW